ncbi:hypothetical protein N9L68_09115 [bacterium]|nr:hypothetical protein [bacterium]
MRPLAPPPNPRSFVCWCQIIAEGLRGPLRGQHIPARSGYLRLTLAHCSIVVGWLVAGSSFSGVDLLHAWNIMCLISSSPRTKWNTKTPPPPPPQTTTGLGPGPHLSSYLFLQYSLPP